MRILQVFLQRYPAVLDDLVVEDQLAFHWVVGEELLAFLQFLCIVLEVIHYRFGVDMGDCVSD